MSSLSLLDYLTAREADMLKAIEANEKLINLDRDAIVKATDQLTGALAFIREMIAAARPVDTTPEVSE